MACLRGFWQVLGAALVDGGVALPGPLGDPPGHQGWTRPWGEGLVRSWLAGRGGKGGLRQRR